MKKDGNINFKLIDKMMLAFYKKQGNPEIFKKIAQEILGECRDISKYQYLSRQKRININVHITLIYHKTIKIYRI